MTVSAPLVQAIDQLVRVPATLTDYSLNSVTEGIEALATTRVRGQMGLLAGARERCLRAGVRDCCLRAGEVAGGRGCGWAGGRAGLRAGGRASSGRPARACLSALQGMDG